MKDKHTVILEELTIAGMRCERIKKMDFLSRMADDNTCPTGVLFTAGGNESEWIN